MTHEEKTSPQPLLRAQLLAALASALMAASIACLPGPAQAAGLSPHFRHSGEKAYDIYNDAVMCSAVLEAQAEKTQDAEARKRLENAARDALVFALTMLRTGQVADMSDTVLEPDIMPIERRNARSDWRIVASTLEDEGGKPAIEAARCLEIYEAQGPAQGPAQDAPAGAPGFRDRPSNGG